MSTTILNGPTAIKGSRTTTAKPFFNLLTAYGLIGIGTGFTAMIILVFKLGLNEIFTLSPPNIFTLMAFAFAALILFTRWRWTPVLGILYGGVQILVNMDRMLNIIAGAQDLADFYLSPFILILVFITFGAGILALYQNYSRKQHSRHMPQWVTQLMYTCAGVIIGVYIMGFLLPDPSLLAGPSVPDNIPMLSVENPQKEIVVEAGKPTLIKLSNSYPHTAALHVEALQIQTVMRQGESFLLIFPPKEGSYKYVVSMGFYKKKAPENGIRNQTGAPIQGIIVAK
jgi:hypothetical protein